MFELVSLSLTVYVCVVCKYRCIRWNGGVRVEHRGVLPSLDVPSAQRWASYICVQGYQWVHRLHRIMFLWGILDSQVYSGYLQPCSAETTGHNCPQKPAYICHFYCRTNVVRELRRVAEVKTSCDLVQSLDLTACQRCVVCGPGTMKRCIVLWDTAKNKCLDVLERAARGRLIWFPRYDLVITFYR